MAQIKISPWKIPLSFSGKLITFLLTKILLYKKNLMKKFDLLRPFSNHAFQQADFFNFFNFCCFCFIYIFFLGPRIFELLENSEHDYRKSRPDQDFA